MRIFRHTENLPEDLKGGVVTLGNFDGLHRGHREVLAIARREARQLKAPLMVLTTEPHPRQYFNPDAPSFRLMNLRNKARMLEEEGVDALFVLHFDAAIANMLAQDFVLDLIVGQLGARHIVTGYDQRFGKNRGGGTTLLQYMGEMEGFGVTVVEPVSAGGEVYSSTRIRNFLREGQPERAADLLGHWWRIEGKVEMGDQRGRTIGFPTANLPWDDYLQPALGVYAVRVEVEDGPHKGEYDGVANIGKRPTFDKDKVNFEVHLFDFKGDIYGAHLGVEIVAFIRPEKKFDGLEELKAQIDRDAKSARRLLGEPEFAPNRPMLRD